MMELKDEACLARGFVSPSWVDVDTGRRMAFSQRHNQLSYMSAEAMAAAFGGDPSYIPSRVGFIYGDSDGLFTNDVSRYQTWSGIEQELSDANVGANCDIQVVGFSYSPTLGGADGENDDSKYSTIKSGGSNAITFHAVSNSQDDGYLSKSGSNLFGSGKYVYQALLLGFNGSTFYPISRVSLKDNGNYRTKPEGFEIALDWTIVFK
jgi:hypothetical protein